MSEDLKPCPFCGGESTGLLLEETADGLTGRLIIGCDDCDYEVPGVLSIDPTELKQSAIAAWNRRPGPEPGWEADLAMMLRRVTNMLDDPKHTNLKRQARDLLKRSGHPGSILRTQEPEPPPPPGQAGEG